MRIAFAGNPNSGILNLTGNIRQSILGKFGVPAFAKGTSQIGYGSIPVGTSKTAVYGQFDHLAAERILQIASY